ncbi:MAG: SdpI family protein [Fimbriimonadaceae bacterium]
MKRRHLAYCLLIVIATLGYALSVYGSLPEVVPVHWGVSGKPDGWAGKSFLLWFVPAMQVFIVALIAGLAAIPSQARRIAHFSDVLGHMVIAFTGFFAWLEWLMVQAAMGRDFLSKGLMLAMFLLFAFLGNMMGKMRRNSVMGIRTPWTLASDEAWHATHRWSARYMVVVALVGFAATLAGASIWLQLALLMAWGFGPLVYSLKFRPKEI